MSQIDQFEINEKDQQIGFMNIKLREWKKDDLEDLVRFADNRKIWNNLSNAFPSPYTKEAAEIFITKTLEDDPRKILAIDLDGVAIGSIGIFPEIDIHRKNAAIAYWIAESYWGKGIASLAVKLMIDYGLANFEITRIYAKPFGYNKASHRVLEKVGFVREAIIRNGVFKNNQYFDEHIYSIRKTT